LPEAIPDHQQADNGTVHLKEPLLSSSTGAFVVFDFRASKAVTLS
jgi:hypothetical protein